jgi:hypothetical protein
MLSQQGPRKNRGRGAGIGAMAARTLVLPYGTLAKKSAGSTASWHRPAAKRACSPARHATCVGAHAAAATCAGGHSHCIQSPAWARARCPARGERAFERTATQAAADLRSTVSLSSGRPARR